MRRTGIGHFLSSSKTFCVEISSWASFSALLLAWEVVLCHSKGISCVSGAGWAPRVPSTALPVPVRSCWCPSLLPRINLSAPLVHPSWALHWAGSYSWSGLALHECHPGCFFAPIIKDILARVLCLMCHLEVLLPSKGKGFPSSDPREGSSLGAAACAGKNLGNTTAPSWLLPPSVLFLIEIIKKKNST